MTDGVYVDATWRSRDADAGLGAVVMQSFKIVSHHHRRQAGCASNVEAEVAAAEWGFTLHPDLPVFTDSTSAAEATGATWIPRERNQYAHAAAHGVYKPFDLLLPMERVAPARPKFKKQRRRVGRGVLTVTR